MYIGHTSSSSSSNPKAKDTPLVRKLDVPVEHLDYEYVRNSTDTREIEKILRILRSGEEGRYEDLEAFVENRLKALQPTSRYLRVEVPVLTHSSLERSEVESLDTDLLNWIQEVEVQEDVDAKNAALTHGGKFNSETHVDNQIPVRGTQIVISANESSITSKTDDNDNDFIKQRHPDHIKSWEYDKWAKFNVDAELTKLDIEDMRRDELSRIEMDKLMSKDIEKRDPESHSRGCGQSAASSASGSGVKGLTLNARTELGPPYIEEIPAIDTAAPRAADVKKIKECLADNRKSDEPKQNQDASSKGKRRFKIVIDDINIG